MMIEYHKLRKKNTVNYNLSRNHGSKNSSWKRFSPVLDNQAHIVDYL